jgi:hypothetical protein
MTIYLISGGDFIVYTASISCINLDTCSDKVVMASVFDKFPSVNMAIVCSFHTAEI